MGCAWEPPKAPASQSREQVGYLTYGGWDPTHKRDQYGAEPHAENKRERAGFVHRHSGHGRHTLVLHSVIARN